MNDGKVRLTELPMYWTAQAKIRFGPVKKLLPPIAQNPHVIVGDGNQCLCGYYESVNDGGSIPITCTDILSALEHAEHFGFKVIENDLKILRAAITPLIRNHAPNSRETHTYHEGIVT
jgi:hypothetical protein